MVVAAVRCLSRIQKLRSAAHGPGLATTHGRVVAFRCSPSTRQASKTVDATTGCLSNQVHSHSQASTVVQRLSRDSVDRYPWPGEVSENSIEHASVPRLGPTLCCWSTIRLVNRLVTRCLACGRSGGDGSRQCEQIDRREATSRWSDPRRPVGQFDPTARLDHQACPVRTAFIASCQPRVPRWRGDECSTSSPPE